MIEKVYKRKNYRSVKVTSIPTREYKIKPDTTVKYESNTRERNKKKKGN